MPAIAADGVTIRFGGDTVACDNVSFSLRPGSSLAVIGASGSGKTSLLLCGAGLLKPTAGDVEIGGAPLWHASGRERAARRRSDIGYVAQFGDVIPELTLLENVALPLRLLGKGPRQAYATAIARMNQLGIDHLARRYSDEVSGGELQRCALARSLVHDPAVLVADEPTAALDEDNRLLVTTQLLEAAQVSGCAVVMATHDETLAKAADRIIRMADGRLTPSPTP